MNVYSLFSGIGGFDLGFEYAGMTIAGMCERDEKARAVLARRFPSAPIACDVREVRIEPGAIDLVCGGFPCQDVSTAGKRAGLAGDRSGLWWEFARVVDEAQPRWVVVENVPGLFTSAGGRDFTAIVRWLANRGYGVGWRMLDAQGFGLPQRRKRVFIVGSFGTRDGCTVLLDGESVRGDFDPGRSARKNHSGAVAHTLTAVTARRPDGGINLVPVFGINGQSPQWTAMAETSHTLSTSKVEQVASFLFGIRRLTPLECERLQGFPDRWTEGQADSHRYHQLGNAVAVPVAKWIGDRIMQTGGAS